MDVMVKATLVPGGLVGVDDALTGHAINDGYCILVGSFGLGTVSTTDGLNHLFDVGTKLGTMIHVLLTTDFGLACALFCLDSVGQKDDSWGVRTEKVEYCADGTDLCLPICSGYGLWEAISAIRFGLYDGRAGVRQRFHPQSTVGGHCWSDCDALMPCG